MKIYLSNYWRKSSIFIVCLSAIITVATAVFCIQSYDEEDYILIIGALFFVILSFCLQLNALKLLDYVEVSNNQFIMYYYPRESETMPGDDNDKLLTEKQAIAILNARIAPDNDKMIREIDHKVVINGKPYFLAHAYTVGRDFTFTHGWYIVDRETGDLYKAYAAADLYYYIEKD